jgi:glycosyltransferase involved in cell wall biosynthesis
MTKLSIITINYNDVIGLKRTFESVISQSCKEFEYIVIDGASVDGSKEFLEQNNSHINYWVSEADKGIYNAMNKGIKAANGEYLLFLNSGDTLYSDNSLQSILKCLEKGDKDIYYGNLINRGDMDELYSVPKEISFMFFYSSSLPHPSTFIRRSCLIEMGGFDESLKIVSDWKFFILGIFKNGFSFQYIEEIISVFYLGGISNINTDLALKERNLILNEEFPLLVSDYHEYQLLKFYFKKYKLEFFKKIIVFFKSKNYFR